MTLLPAPFCLLTPCSILPLVPLLSLLFSLSLFLPSSLFPLLTFFLLPFFFLLPCLPPSSPPSSSLLLLSYFLCPSLALAQGLGPSCMVEGSDNSPSPSLWSAPTDPKSYCTPTRGVHRCLLQRSKLMWETRGMSLIPACPGTGG